MNFTEQSAKLTANIDVASPLEMVRLFRMSDEQLLQPHFVDSYAGLAHADTAEKLLRAHAVIKGLLEGDPNAIVVMAGVFFWGFFCLCFFCCSPPYDGEP